MDMSEMARTDEIDELVSSVRDFVSHKDAQQVLSHDRLMLTPELRVAQDAEIRIDVDPVAPDAVDMPDNVLKLSMAKPDRAGLEATIAELEAAVTAQSDDWEPDGGESFSEPEAWAASAFDKPVVVEDADSVAEVADRGPEPFEPLEIDAMEAAIAARVTSGLDEEDLRALVVATVHDELNGDLGERITRNVRKLVRREINRVLATRELGQD